MSDDTNDIFANNDDSTQGDKPSDPSLDFGDEFGLVKFADDDSAPAISFSDSPADQLPHWTQAPTGEIPKFIETAEDTISPTPSYGSSRSNVNVSGSTRRIEPNNPPAPVPRDQRENRISIGTDPTDERSRPNSPVSSQSQASGNNPKPARPAQVTRTRPSGRSDSGTAPRSPQRSRSNARQDSASGRDLPTATAVGALLGAVYIAATIFGPVAVMVLLILALGLASFEFFTQTSSANYQPAMIVGITGCIAAPLAAYWIGDAALPLVFVFSFIAGAISFIGTSSVDSGSVPNLGITMLGIIWIGLFGSFGALILRLSNSGPGFENVGTDTLFLVVVGVIANDVAAFFVGAATGRTPLRSWISPSKTMEGFVGGAIGTFVVVIMVGLQSGTWTKLSQWLIIAFVISIIGPLGDLTESMFKRNLDIKDFGTLLRGHGGALDRFDSMLFVLPVVYYVTLVLTPWAS